MGVRLPLFLAIALMVISGCGTAVHRVSVREATPRSSGPDPHCASWLTERGAPFSCAHLPSALKPADARRARAWEIYTGTTDDGRILPGPLTYLVAWDGPNAGWAVWRRQEGHWSRAKSGRTQTGFLSVGAFVDDVTADQRADVMITTGSGGSGQCTEDTVLGVDRTTVTTLFRGSACEVYSNMQDGLLYFREPIGGCTPPHAHCYSGVRVTIRGWTGDRLTTDQVINRCLRPRVDPANDCEPSP